MYVNIFELFYIIADGQQEWTHRAWSHTYKGSLKDDLEKFFLYKEVSTIESLRVFWVCPNLLTVFLGRAIPRVLGPHPFDIYQFSFSIKKIVFYIAAWVFWNLRWAKSLRLFLWMLLTLVCCSLFILWLTYGRSVSLSSIDTIIYYLLKIRHLTFCFHFCKMNLKHCGRLLLLFKNPEPISFLFSSIAHSFL